MVIFVAMLIYQRVPSNCRSSTDFLQKGNYFDNLTTQSPKLFEMESVHWQIKVDSQQQTSWLSSKCPLCHLVGWWLNIQRKPWLVGGFNPSEKYETKNGFFTAHFPGLINQDGETIHSTIAWLGAPMVIGRILGRQAEMNSELLQDSNFCWCQVPKPWQRTWINMFSKVSTMWGPQTL